MDDRHFDRLTRSLAGGISRRRMLGSGLAAGWLALRRRGTSAQDDEIVGIDNDPCMTVACPPDQRCVAGACCPEGQACGGICCPPGTIGCTAPVGPGGGPAPISCLCPDGLIYDDWTNACRDCRSFGDACRNDGDCCSGVCQGGACSCISGGGSCEIDEECCVGQCADGVCTCVSSGGTCSSNYDCCGAACVDGVCSTCTAAGGGCRTDDECCGKKTHSGKAPFEEWGTCVDGICHCCYHGSSYLRCGPGYPYRDDLEYPTAGLCCDYPTVRYGCCADPTDCATCTVGCCTDGVDCDVAAGIYPGCPARPATVESIPPDPFACTT